MDKWYSITFLFGMLVMGIIINAIIIFSPLVCEARQTLGQPSSSWEGEGVFFVSDLKLPRFEWLKIDGNDGNRIFYKLTGMEAVATDWYCEERRGEEQVRHESISEFCLPVIGEGDVNGVFLCESTFCDYNGCNTTAELLSIDDFVESYPKSEGYICYSDQPCASEELE